MFYKYSISSLLIIALVQIFFTGNITAQSLQGTWGGKLSKNNNLHEFELIINKNQQGVKTKIAIGICSAVSNNPRVTFNRQTGEIVVIETNNPRNSNENPLCEKRKFGQKTFYLYPFVGADGSYLILQGLAKSSSGNVKGFVYLSKKINSEEAQYWRKYANQRLNIAAFNNTEGNLLYKLKSSKEGICSFCNTKMKNNVLTIKSKGNASYEQSLGEKLPTNFDLTVDFQLHEYPHNLKIQWGANGDPHKQFHHQIEVNGLNLSIAPVRDGKVKSTIYNQPLPGQIILFETNQIRIRKILNQVQYYVNGNLVYKGSTPIESKSRIHFITGKGETKVKRLSLHSLDHLAPQMVIEDIAYVDRQSNRNIVGITPGILFLKVKNNGKLTAPSLNLRVSSPQNRREVNLWNTQQSTADIPPGYEQTIKILVDPNEYLKDGEISFNFQLLASDREISKTSKKIISESFFKRFPAQSFNKLNREKALSHFWGYEKVNITAGRRLLDQQIQQGDHLANMWKGIFQWQGYYGYSYNPTEAYLIAQKMMPHLYQAARTGSAEARYLMYHALNMDVDFHVPSGFKGKLLQKAISMNYGPAIFDQALAKYEAGRYAQADELAKKAAQQGLTRAWVLQGVIEETINKNVFSNKAYPFYLQAAKKGDPNAMLAIDKLKRKSIFQIDSSEWKQQAMLLGFNDYWNPMAARPKSDISITNKYGYTIKVALHFRKDGYWKTVGWVSIPPYQTANFDHLPPHKNPVGADQLYYNFIGNGKESSGSKIVCIEPGDSFLRVGNSRNECLVQKGFTRISKTNGVYSLTLENVWMKALVWLIKNIDWSSSPSSSSSGRSSGYDYKAEYQKAHLFDQQTKIMNRP